jgi:hypothetical protein
MNLSRNGFMAGSLQNWLCGALRDSRVSAPNPADKTSKVSGGRSFSAGGITAKPRAGQGSDIMSALRTAIAS